MSRISKQLQSQMKQTRVQDAEPQTRPVTDTLQSGSTFLFKWVWASAATWFSKCELLLVVQRCCSPAAPHLISSLRAVSVWPRCKKIFFARLRPVSSPNSAVPQGESQIVWSLSRAHPAESPCLSSMDGITLTSLLHSSSLSPREEHSDPWERAFFHTEH